MRRAVIALVAGGVLLAAAACGTAPAPSSTGSGAAAGTQAPASTDPKVQASLTDTRQVCEAVGKANSKDIGPFAASVSKLVASRKAGGTAAAAAKQDAQHALVTYGEDLRAATQGSANEQVRADGTTVADTLKAKAADNATFDQLKTNTDIATLLGPTMTEWTAPVSKHCK
jgi:hypothetical protein